METVIMLSVVGTLLVGWWLVCNISLYRIAILVAMFVAALVGLFFLEPISQSETYHRFVDSRSSLGIPNFVDVMSNLPFVVTGGFGLWYVLGPAGRGIFDDRADRWPYVVFFIGVALVSVGSAYYHLAPNNARLFWDRLPMTVAFMALFSAFIADRIHRRIGNYWLLPMFLSAGFLSVAYWDWSESLGRGDLRWYYLVQFYPIVVLPVICWLFPSGRYTSGWHLAWMIAWYAAAKVLEIFDVEVFELLGNTVSGHSLKHLASAVAVLVVVRMIAFCPLHQLRNPALKDSARLKKTKLILSRLVGALVLVGLLAVPAVIGLGIFFVILGILGVFPPLLLFGGDLSVASAQGMLALLFLLLSVVVEGRVLLWRHPGFSFNWCLRAALFANLASAVVLMLVFDAVLGLGLPNEVTLLANAASSALWPDSYYGFIRPYLSLGAFVLFLSTAWPMIVVAIEGLVIFRMRVESSIWRSMGLGVVANIASLVVVGPIVLTLGYVVYLIP